jgi:U3 small nucleolar RNA-associated protein 14
VTLKSTDILSPPASDQPRRLSTPEPSTTESNPWLAPQISDVTMKAPRKKNEILLSKESTALTKSKNKLKKQVKKREDEKEKTKDDAVVEISMDNVLSLGGEASAPTPATKSAQEKATTSRKGSMTDGATADDDSDVNSEVEAQEIALDMKGKAKTKGLKAFEQRDLVALAFAGDNVVHVSSRFVESGSVFNSFSGVPRSKTT